MKNLVLLIPILLALLLSSCKKDKTVCVTCTLTGQHDTKSETQCMKESEKSDYSISKEGFYNIYNGKVIPFDSYSNEGVDEDGEPWDLICSED